MRKTIIIDDRPDRKKLHLPDDAISQLKNLEDEGFLTFSDGKGYESNFTKLEEYDMIAIHRTFLTNLNNIQWRQHPKHHIAEWPPA